MQVKGLRNRYLWALILIVVGALIVARVMSGVGPTEVTLPQFIESAKQGQIDTIRQTGDIVEGLIDGKVTFSTHFLGTTDELVSFLQDEGVILGGEGIQFVVEPSGLDWRAIGLTVILPIVLLGALCYFLFSHLSRISRSLAQLAEQRQPPKPETKEKKTRDIDSSEAIRKLAELRDQGILTQEEFEQKKKKLL
jgi:predicted PurR-regulated permease PerM